MEHNYLVHMSLIVSAHEEAPHPPTREVIVELTRSNLTAQGIRLDAENADILVDEWEDVTAYPDGKDPKNRGPWSR